MNEEERTVPEEEMTPEEVEQATEEGEKYAGGEIPRVSSPEES